MLRLPCRRGPEIDARGRKAERQNHRLPSYHTAVKKAKETKEERKKSRKKQNVGVQTPMSAYIKLNNLCEWWDGKKKVEEEKEWFAAAKAKKLKR